ncbi:hypothetical protein [Streptomyces sp. NPDC002067]
MVVRNVFGSLIALIGATAAVWSPFRPWYDGRPARDVRIEDLFGGLTRAAAELPGSLFLPMAFAALLTLAGVVLRSRAPVAVAGVVVLGFTILWMVRQGQAAGSLTAGPRGGLGDGVAFAFGGGLLLLLGAVVMPGHHPARGRHSRGRDDDRAPRGTGPPRERGAAPYGEQGYGSSPGAHDAPPAPVAPPWDPGRPPAQEWRPPPPLTPGPPPEENGRPQPPTPPVRWAEELRRHPGTSPQAGAEEPHAPMGAHASGATPAYGTGPAEDAGPSSSGPGAWPAPGGSPDATVPFPPVRPGGRTTGAGDGAAGPLDETVRQQAVRPYGTGPGSGRADGPGGPGPGAPGAHRGPRTPGPGGPGTHDGPGTHRGPGTPDSGTAAPASGSRPPAENRPSPEEPPDPGAPHAPDNSPPPDEPPAPGEPPRHPGDRHDTP